MHSHNTLQHSVCVPTTTAQTGCCSGISLIGLQAGRGLCEEKIIEGWFRYHQVMLGCGLHSQIWTNTCGDCDISAGLTGAVLMAGCDKNCISLLAEELGQGAVS